jgi:hypothetical protein
MPLVCTGTQLDRVLHITATSGKLGDQLPGKDVLVWDSGKGTRMAVLLQAGQTKGDVVVTGGHRLYHFAAGAAQWAANILREMDRDYIAFVASDQILCLSEPDKKELVTLLDAASSQDADIIFFDGPPALSLLRLRFLIDPARPPRRDGVMALARDRLLLERYGGAHVLQCLLVKRSLVPALATVLEATLEAAGNGYYWDCGVADVAVLPRLVRPDWLMKERHPAARRIGVALCKWCDHARRVRSVSMPLRVFNVNMPCVLDHLKTRIRCPAP